MNKLCTVLAYDPGGVTGWAAITVYPGAFTELDRDLHDIIHGHPDPLVGWWWGQLDAKLLGSTAGGMGANRGHDSLNFPGENKVVDMMLDLREKYPRAATVLEKFVLDPKVATRAGGTYDLLAPVRIISAYSYAHVKSGLDSRNGEDFYLVNRGDPKRIVTDTKIERWGFGAVNSHATRHARDATRIAYHFLRDCRGNSFGAQEKRHRAWPHIFADPARTVPAKAARTQPRLLGERI